MTNRFLHMTDAGLLTSVRARHFVDNGSNGG